MCGVLFRLCDERFHIGLQSLCLGNGCLNPLVENQRSSHIGKEGFAMTALAAKVVDCFIVPHTYTVFFLGSILNLVTSIPNESFIFSTSKSISLRDFLPKFLNFISSDLE